jgi:hypothetical protein
MRPLMWLVLAGLSLSPALAAAQDDSPRDRGRDCDHRRDGRCEPRGLREVSDRRSQRRQGFWFSAGVGAGAESFDANDGLGWSDDKGGGIAYLKLGGTVSQSLRLGAEGNIWGARYQRQGYDRSLGSLLFIAQWYPSSRGDFWLRGGAGWARDNLTLYGAQGDITSHENGTALALGLGYDFRVSREVSITPTLDFQGQRYDSHDERLVSLGVGITFR